MKRNEYQRQYYITHKKEILAKQKAYYTKNKDRFDDYKGGWDKRNRLLLKATIFIALGGCCKCCGETDYRFLSIDHINGGGNESTRQHGTHTTYWKYIIKQGIPTDKYQLLCHSCNQAKSNKSACPHSNFSIFNRDTWY